jgi:chemotaxis signal transduction protein
MSAIETITEAGSEQIVVFSLTDGEYALRMRDVKEIIPYTKPRAVSSDQAVVQGVISLRGLIIPVCDVAALFGAYADKPHGNIIVVESGEVVAGILVERVEEVLTISQADVAHVAAAAELTNTIAKRGDRLIVLLDADKLLGDLHPVSY